MLTVSNDYKTAIVAPTRQMRAYLRFNNATNLRGCDGLISIDWKANLFDEERPTFGCAVASSVEVKFYTNNLSGISYETSYIDAYIGIVTKDTGTAPSGSIEPDTATVEYMHIGRFFITDVEYDDNIVTATAYDVFYRLSKEYVPTVTRSSSGYAVKDILNDIFTQCSMGYNTISTNYGYVQTVYSGTCREQLGWMTAFMSNYGISLVASRTSNTVYKVVDPLAQWSSGYTSYNITDASIYEGGIDIKPDYTVTSITSGTADAPIVSGSGLGLERENPNITQTKVSSLYTNWNNKSFTPMTVEFRGDPRIEVGDVIKVTHNSTDYRCWVHSIHAIFNGGLSCSLECYGDSEATYQMSTAPTAAKIDSIKTEVGEIIQRINAGDEGYCTKIYDSNGNWTEFLITDQMDYTQATSVWRFNLNGLSHSTSYSGGTYSFALDDQGRIVANRILVGRIQGTGSASYWDFDNDEINLTGSFTMTGGSINITTSSLSQDVIKLTYGSSSSIMRSQGFEVASVGLSPYYKSTLTYDGLTITDNGTTSASIAKDKIWVGTHSGTTPTNAIILDYANGITYQGSSSAIYAKINLDGDGIGRLQLGKGAANKPRVTLDKDALKFYNSSGTEIRSYPATGLNIGDLNMSGTISSTNSSWDLTNDTVSMKGTFTMTGGSIALSSTTADIIKVTATGYGITSIGQGAFTATSSGLSPAMKGILGYNSLVIKEGSSTNRVQLTTSGLVFKDSNGTETMTYPATGLTLPYKNITMNGEETSDLDNCTDSGRYTFTSAAAHNPYSAGGVVDVYKNSSTHYYQLAFSNSTANDDVAYINVRKHNADGFHAWQRIITPAQGVVTLNGNTATSYSTSGTTQTFALDNGLYLVTTSRTNSTSTAQDGVWLVQSHTTSSHLTALLTPSGTTTVSINAGTLTLTTGSNNVRITITKLS